MPNNNKVCKQIMKYSKNKKVLKANQKDKETSLKGLPLAKFKKYN